MSDFRRLLTICFFNPVLIQTINTNKESETMKLIRVFIAAIFISIFLTAVTSAQTQPKPQATPQPTPQTQTPPAKPAPVPVAFIYSPWFVDDKTGIKRFVAAIVTVNNEFRPINQELGTLSNRVNTLTAELNAMQQTDPTFLTKAEELNRLKNDLEYKQKSAKAALEKRQREFLEPIESHVYEELRNYVKQFGIKVTIDVAKIQDAVVFYSVEADITRAFIADYNARFPVGAPTPPATTPVKQP